MRAVVAHANGVDISEVDGYYAVVSVDAGEVQEGETGTTMACRMEDIAVPGALRDDFIGTLQQRCDSVAQTKIGTCQLDFRPTSNGKCTYCYFNFMLSM